MSPQALIWVRWVTLAVVVVLAAWSFRPAKKRPPAQPGTKPGDRGA